MKNFIYFMVGFFGLASVINYYAINDKMTAYFYYIMMFLAVILKILKEDIQKLRDKDEHCNCGK